MDFLQLLLEANAALEAQPSQRFTRVIDAVDALENRPSQTSINFRILREVSCDNRRCVNYQLLAIVGEKGVQAEMMNVSKPISGALLSATTWLSAASSTVKRRNRNSLVLVLGSD
jgi:hypothetical protein